MLGGGFGVAWTSGIFSGVMAPARALNLFSVQHTVIEYLEILYLT